jgi:hypothetical protein
MKNKKLEHLTFDIHDCLYRSCGGGAYAYMPVEKLLVMGYRYNEVKSWYGILQGPGVELVPIKHELPEYEMIRILLENEPDRSEKWHDTSLICCKVDAMQLAIDTLKNDDRKVVIDGILCIDCCDENGEVRDAMDGCVSKEMLVSMRGSEKRYLILGTLRAQTSRRYSHD